MTPQEKRERWRQYACAALAGSAVHIRDEGTGALVCVDDAADVANRMCELEDVHVGDPLDRVPEELRALKKSARDAGLL